MTQSRSHCAADGLFCRWFREKRAPVAVHGSVAACNDGRPVTPGHLLIVPKRHVADGLDLNAQERQDGRSLAGRLVERIQQDDPFVTGFNIGASAGQTVMHTHIHLILWRDGDTDNFKGGVRGVLPGRRSC